MTNNFFQTNFKKIIILILIVLFFIFTSIYIHKKPNSTKISVASTTIYAQIADTPNARSMGLSYTDNLATDTGMLFVFDDVNVKNFWMRDMNYDLDIIWIDDQKEVVGFFENVSKDSYNHTDPELSKIFHSPENTKYVLEVPVGTIRNNKIKVGDKLDFAY